MLTMGVYKHRNKSRSIDQFSIRLPTQISTPHTLSLIKKCILYVRFDATLLQYVTGNQKVKITSHEVHIAFMNHPHSVKLTLLGHIKNIHTSDDHLVE